MGGTSSSNQTQTQSSQTNPWAPAQGTLTGILGQLNSYLPQTGITGTQTGAINQMEQNAGNNGQFTPGINNSTSNLLGGGGALDQSGMVQGGYDQYRANTSPLANNTNYDPMQTPGIGDQLSALKDNITQSVNGQFAAAGRDGSGYNSKALGAGLTAGLAPILTNQYNQNVQNQQGAAGNLYNAGNSTGGLLSNMRQNFNTNQQAGVNQVGTGLQAQNSGAMTTLMAEAQKLGIPMGNLGLLANIGIPIAQTGSQSSGTGTSTGTQTMSGAQQFGTIANGVGQFAKFLPSDRALKEDITQVGTLFDGTPVYRYRYIGQPAFQIGLMAQDIEKVTPEAVGMIGQFKAVDYKLATDKAVEAA